MVPGTALHCGTDIQDSNGNNERFGNFDDISNNYITLEILLRLFKNNDYIVATIRVKSTTNVRKLKLIH